MIKKIFDVTLIEHMIIAFVISVIGFLVSYLFWRFFNVTIAYYSGQIIAVTWFVCRECVQAEYRWIEKFGEGLRSNMPWWGFMDYRVWDIPSVLDILSAVVGVCLAGAIRFLLV